MYTLHEAAVEADSLEADKLVTELEKTDRVGAQGVEKFGPNHDVIYSATDPSKGLSLLYFQYQADGSKKIVYPADLAEGNTYKKPAGVSCRTPTTGPAAAACRARRASCPCPVRRPAPWRFPLSARRPMDVLVQGALTSATIALVALGFSLVYGVGGIVNLAHGSFFMIGAYTAYAVQRQRRARWWSRPWPASRAAMVAGVLLERLVIAPIRHQEVAVLIATLAVAILVESLTRFFFGGLERQLPSFVARPRCDVLGVPLPAEPAARRHRRGGRHRHRAAGAHQDPGRPGGAGGRRGRRRPPCSSACARSG